MAKAVTTINEMVVAYGGKAKMMRAFGLRDLEQWHGGVPRGHEIGVYLGLEARGYRVSPRLFGVRRWSEVQGIGRRWP